MIAKIKGIMPLSLVQYPLAHSILAITLLCPFFVYADAELVKPSFDYMASFGSLLFVLFVIIGLAWLLKKTRLINPGQGQMSVMASLTLGTKEKVMVIEVAGEQFLIGVTAGQINLLNKLETPITNSKGTEPAFASQLSALLGKHGQKK